MKSGSPREISYGCETKGATDKPRYEASEDSTGGTTGDLGRGADVGDRDQRGQAGAGHGDAGDGGTVAESVMLIEREKMAA